MHVYSIGPFDPVIIKNICNWSLILEILGELDVVMHTFNPSTQEADEFLGVLGQSGLYRETMSQNNKKKSLGNHPFFRGWGEEETPPNKTANR